MLTNSKPTKLNTTIYNVIMVFQCFWKIDPWTWIEWLFITLTSILTTFNWRSMFVKWRTLRSFTFFFVEDSHGCYKNNPQNVQGTCIILIPKHDNKIVLCAPPRKDHDSKWFIGKHLNATILQMHEVPNPGYGWVHSIESDSGMMTMTYEVTIGLIPNYINPNFVFMSTNLKK
jgi:hypothetical protein